MRRRVRFTKIKLLPLLLFFIILASTQTAAAINSKVISRRDLVIDLGDGVETLAQLTYPAVGDGPFPGVLLIHGSGSTDMDHYIPASATGTGEPSRMFLQITEYLSTRGFAVLRYNKRGIGANGSILNSEAIIMNHTFQGLKHDAEIALKVLLEQDVVDTGDITILGNSEGAMIAPWIVAENPQVGKLVLHAAVARNLKDILQYQLVERRAAYLDKVVDGNRDGLISIQEVVENADSDPFTPVPDFTMIMNSSGEWIWLPGVDIDGDSKVSIIDEYIPRQTGVIDILTSPMNPTHRWFQSYFELDSTLSMIGNVSCSVLIQQGEDDVQTPVQEAFLLDQRLTDVGHADHSVISYSGLGHTFYPVNGWRQPLGPMGEEVLADLAAWLTDPARKVHILDSKLQTATYTIEELQGQLGDLNSELDQQTSRLEDQITELIAESTDIQSSVIELERQNMEFQLVLDSTKNMTYIAFGVALIAVLSGVVIMIQNRKS